MPAHKKYSPSSVMWKARSIAPVALIVLLVASAFIVVGVLFYLRGTTILKEQLRSRLKDTAAAAAMQFAGMPLHTIQSGATLSSSPVLREAVQRLQALRENVGGIRFAYIMEKTDLPNTLAFIADADLALTPEALDRNTNGVLEDDEQPSLPGELYPASHLPALLHEAFLGPTADSDINEDQWGAVISGYAPIKNADGSVVAILGVDMSADEYLAISESIISPAALLLTLFAMIAIGGSTTLYLWRRRLEILHRLETERSGLLRLAFHQLGGPLTIISWSIEELEEEGPASIQRTIANIQEGVKRLTGILKMLKDADLVHTGKVDYKPELASVSSILEKVVKEAGAKLAVRRQSVDLKLQENITMNLDTKLIAGVAEELLTNAIDFSPDRSTITVSCRKVGRKAEFKIDDCGCGIPKKDQPRMFGEFTRGSNATKFKADGNGLGLYIVKGIVEHAGGSVKIQSTEGKGTTVTVQLPLA